MMTILSDGCDNFGRDVQVPGGSRFTRAGGLWLGEKELNGEKWRCCC